MRSRFGNREMGQFRAVRVVFLLLYISLSKASRRTSLKLGKRRSLSSLLTFHKLLFLVDSSETMVFGLGICAKNQNKKRRSQIDTVEENGR